MFRAETDTTSSKLRLRPVQKNARKNEPISFCVTSLVLKVVSKSRTSEIQQCKMKRD